MFGIARLNTLAANVTVAKVYSTIISMPTAGDAAYWIDAIILIVKTSTGVFRKLSAYKTSEINTGFNTGSSVTLNPAGTSLAVGLFASPWIAIYNTSNYNFTNISSPITLTETPYYIQWSPDSNYLAFETASSPFLNVYSRSGDTFTKLSNPATLPGQLGTSIAWNKQGTTIAAGQSTTPWILFYNFNGTTLTKIANPSSLPPNPTNSPYGIDWNPAGTSVSFGINVSPWIQIYNRSGDTFTKLSNPATLPNALVKSTAWNPAGTSLAVGYSTTIIVYNRSGDTFTSVGTITETIANTVDDIKWSSDGLSLYVKTSTELKVFTRSGDTFTETNPVFPLINAFTNSLQNGLNVNTVEEPTGGLLNTITIATTATSTLSTITIPATAAVNDIAILFDTSTTITNTVPSGWTNISQSSMTGIRTNISYKRIVSGNPGSSVTGMAGSTRKVMLIIRGSEYTEIQPLLSTSSQTAQATLSVPTNQNISTLEASGYIQTGPILQWAAYASTGAIATRGFTAGSPTEYSSVSTSGIYVKALITNYPTAASSQTISMSDGGTNTLQSGYIEFC
jgi:hypothetical protein